MKYAAVRLAFMAVQQWGNGHSSHQLGCLEWLNVYCLKGVKE